MSQLAAVTSSPALLQEKILTLNWLILKGQYELTLINTSGWYSYPPDQYPRTYDGRSLYC